MEFELHPMIYITSIGFPDNSQTDSPLFWMDFGIQKWKAPSQPPPRLRACEHHMSHAHAALRRRGLATRRSENWTPGNDGKRVSQKSSICRTRFCFFWLTGPKSKLSWDMQKDISKHIQQRSLSFVSLFHCRSSTIIQSWPSVHFIPRTEWDLKGVGHGRGSQKKPGE